MARCITVRRGRKISTITMNILKVTTYVHFKKKKRNFSIKILGRLSSTFDLQNPLLIIAY